MIYVDFIRKSPVFDFLCLKYLKILLPSLFDYFSQVEETHGTEIEYTKSIMLKCYNVDKEPLVCHFRNMFLGEIRFGGKSIFVF